MADNSSRTKDFPRVQDTMTALLHALPDPALLIDIDGTICAVNGAALAGSEKQPEELIGTKVYSSHDFSTVTAGLERRVEEVIRSNRPLRTEEVHEGKRVDHSLYPVLDKQEKVAQIVVITRDITEYRSVKEERQRLSKQVKELERTFNGILSASDDRVYVFDKDMRYTYVNPPGARALGLMPKDIAGKTWKELGIPLEPMRRVIALADTVFATGRSQKGELQWDRADGTAQCYEYVHAPIFNSHGDVVSIVSTFRNITERKEAEENVERLAKFPEENPNPVIRLSAEGEILYANKPAQRLLEDWNSSARGAAPQLLRDAAVDALSDRQNKTIEISIRSHVFEFFVAPIIDSGYVNFYGRDIMERKWTEKELQRAHEEAQALNEELQSVNEELRSMNETLEERVQERTLELQNEVDERKKAEQTYHTVFDSVHDAIFIIEGETGTCLDMNDRAYELFGYTINELQKLGAGDPSSSSGLSTKVRLRAVVAEVWNTAMPQMLELDIRDKSGRTLWVESYFKREVIGGQPRILAVGRDITEQKEAEGQFRRSAAIDAALAALYAPLASPTSTAIDVLTVILDEAKRLTGSEHGYVALIDPHTRDLLSFGHTRMELRECGVSETGRPIRFPIGSDGQYPGLWGHALNTKKGFYTNAPADHPASRGTPEGHTPLYQFLTVPVLIEDEVEGQITLANPGKDFNEQDLEAVQRLAEFYALAIQRKRSEEEVRESALYSRNLIEASLDPLVTISAEGKITDVNKATEEVTGYSREELIGTDFSSYFIEPKKARKGYQQVFTEGFVRDYPLAIRHTSGEITDVLYHATVYRDEAGEVQGVFAAARDVTEQKKAQEALKRAHDELEHKVKERTFELQEEIEERKVTEEDLRETTAEFQELTEELRRSNEELEQFAYIASHDLQEPLRTVTSSLGLLEHGYKDKLGEDADTFINYAVDGVIQMQQLIKDLLAYSRVTSRGEKFKPVHCEGIVQSAIDNLRVAIEESGVKITLPEKPLPMVMGDKTQLTQLFQNLIGNAIKFRSQRNPEVQIGVELDAKRKRWTFSAKDNGIGLDMQYADKIFTIFQRLHTTEEYEGTGVGLALCKKIVERHNGTIWVDSKLGEGTTFYFTLPFHADKF